MRISRKGDRIYGCLVGFGKRRLLYTLQNDTVTTDTVLGFQTAGTWIGLDHRATDQYLIAGANEPPQWVVTDLRSGRHYDASTAPGYCDKSVTGLLSSTGWLVQAIDHIQQTGEATCDSRAVTRTITVERGHQPTTIDAGAASAFGAPASLFLDGTTVRWTHDGQPRSYVLPT